jgi:hypothetical protein
MSATSAAAACSGRSNWWPTARRNKIFDPALKMNERVKREALARGVAIYPMGGTIDGTQGDHVIVAPPYIATAADIDTIVESAWAPRWTPRHIAAMRNFSDLTEREILALAIANEEEDGRIYADFAEGCVTELPRQRQRVRRDGREEGEHRRRCSISTVPNSASTSR